jgi:hypothetical protein
MSLASQLSHYELDYFLVKLSYECLTELPPSRYLSLTAQSLVRVPASYTVDVE